ncbi:hypothetical protein FY041_23235 [Pseudomonas monteilii]|nr:hypothetical protein FY041_23235 [Pseudomonas monteilii]QIG25711.1 hypothetical protein FY043_23230 [Pseudomonas monteilii]
MPIPSSCTDSLNRPLRGQARSHRYRTVFEICVDPVGGGLPRRGRHRLNQYLISTHPADTAHPRSAAVQPLPQACR